MSFRRLLLSALLAGATAAGCLAVASPAWAAHRDDDATSGCTLQADQPTAQKALMGVGRRDGCSDTVTYFWVRVYKVIPMWPDAEKAVRGTTYVQDTELTATGPCDGRDQYYTHTSTATGASGDSVESGRATLC
jgi:hypothetical protein